MQREMAEPFGPSGNFRLPLCRQLSLLTSDAILHAETNGCKQYSLLANIVCNFRRSLSKTVCGYPSLSRAERQGPPLAVGQWWGKASSRRPAKRTGPTRSLCCGGAARKWPTVCNMSSSHRLPPGGRFSSGGVARAPRRQARATCSSQRAASRQPRGSAMCRG